MPKKRLLCYILMMVLCTAILTGCQSAEKVTTNTVTGSEFKIHFIDVGQGDSILVECEGETLLIDAGENDKGQIVVDYIKSQGIDELDYVIGTHPHSDHIGGLDVVIDTFSVGKVLLPAIEHSTKTYEDVLVAIQNQGLKITKPVVGTEYSLGEAVFQIIAPNSSEYDDLNDYSVGIRLVYGDTSYVFAGDADAISEAEMCENGLTLSADVLKLNHHGSRYSNNKEFIDAVNPTYAVISVGEGNSYGHPHEEVLEDMKERGITVYRTDLAGTIVITSDGENIEFNTKATEEAYQADTSEVINSNVEDDVVEITQEDNAEAFETYVYVTESGMKYHEDGCSYLKGNTRRLTLEEASDEGYSPCSRCYP